MYELGDIVPLRFTVTDSNGVAANPGSRVLSITLPDGTTTTVSTTNTSTGIFDADYSPTLLGRHVAKFTASGVNAGMVTKSFDVYGATVASPADMRTRYPDLASTAAYPDTKVRDALAGAADQWSRLARVSLAPYASRVTRVGDGGLVLRLPSTEIRSIISFTIDGVAVGASAYVLDAPSGIITMTTGSFTANKAIVIHYEHGLDYTPGAVSDAVMQRALELLVPQMTGTGRVTSVANDLGFQRFNIAQRDGSTGVPDFDATAALYGRMSVGMA